MNIKYKRSIAPSLSVIIMLWVIAMPSSSLAAQAPVLLGSTKNFAILAGTAISNTGPTTISGDVGLSPGAAVSGAGSITLTGAYHVADGVALIAKNDLVTAYNDAVGRTPVTRIATELGGNTLFPGVYDSESGTFNITGTLTLDAEGDPDGVFIFLTQSTLITESNSSVSVINGARFCRIFWQVGSSATLGTSSSFVGHILALTSITAKTGATVQGQLLAREGAVTLDTNTIINGFCETLPTPTPTPDDSVISVPVEAEIILAGRQMREGEFNFVLKDDAGDIIDRATNSSQGGIVFESRRFSRTGLFIYKIEEIKGADKAIVYDKTVYTERINIFATNGVLNYQKEYLKNGVPFDGEIVFRNTYNLPQTGDKPGNDPMLGTFLTLGGSILIFMGIILFLRSRKKPHSQE